MTSEENLSPEDAAEVRGFRKGRLMGLTDAWNALRDAPGGPNMDGLRIVQKLMEEMDESHSGTGNG